MIGAITWEEDGYRLRIPEQEQAAASVQYQAVDNTVMDIHSHGRMHAGFSGQDDKDGQGFRLDAVVGNLGKRPEARLRVGVYGYHWPVDDVETVFDSALPIFDIKPFTDRDPEYPCSEYNPLEEGQASHGSCEGDGHYLCKQCTELAEAEEEGG